MFNIVIVGKDLEYDRRLGNFLNIKNDKIRIFAIITSIRELENIFEHRYIDVILIDIDWFESSILKNNKFIKMYSNSIILISNKEILCEEGIDVIRYAQKSKGLENIGEIVNELINIKVLERRFKLDDINKSLIERIKEELEFLRAKNSYVGVKYLIETIYILYHFENYSKCNLEKEIYPIIAEHHNRKLSNIKSNINYAVNILYVECEEERLLNYLGEYSLCKSSPKKLMCAIIDNIKKVKAEKKLFL